MTKIKETCQAFHPSVSMTFLYQTFSYFKFNAKRMLFPMWIYGTLSVLKSENSKTS